MQQQQQQQQQQQGVLPVATAAKAPAWLLRAPLPSDAAAAASCHCACAVDRACQGVLLPLMPRPPPHTHTSAGFRLHCQGAQMVGGAAPTRRRAVI
jgi:hypothetical protein